MGVYIEGMEMPTTEQGVRTINIYADGVVTNYAEVTIGKAVPVPPHGDLIDRDALLDTATIHWSQTTNESCFPIDEIEDAPTIIPASKEDE